jgi:ribonuclease D
VSARDPSAGLRELADSARASGRLALDTEFMGEGRYRTLLCLIQLATGYQAGMAERIELLDPLDERLDAAPLADVLADPAVEVIVHAGRQDVALARRRLQTDVTNIFDTQVAAGFAGLGSQTSYESLLVQLLGVRLAKTASFTRWDARPLTGEQRSYAREDVLHLLELAAELQRRLVALGRLGWAQEECRALEQASDERDLEVIFARLPRVRALSASARPIARELVSWREQTAVRENRPVQSVLADAALVELARRAPTRASELEQVRGLGSARRRTRELLDAVGAGRERPPEHVREEPRGSRPQPEDAPLVALSEALVRARAREAGIAYELIAARADLQAIVTAMRSDADADVRTLRGWRRELVGEELLQLLDGRVSLSVVGRELRISERDGG